MGLREVVPRIPAILKRVRAAADFALQTRPDLVVLIDSPDFTHRIARRLRRIELFTTHTLDSTMAAAANLDCDWPEHRHSRPDPRPDRRQRLATIGSTVRRV